MAANSNPIICGRKLCSKCGRWRPVSDFSCHQREPLRLYASCYACTRAQQNAWYAEHKEERRRYSAERRAAQLDKMRAYQREWKRKQREDPEKREKAREQGRQSRARMREDPARWAKHLADQRMYYRLRVMRNGGTPRPVSREFYSKVNGDDKAFVGGRVAAAPLAGLISEWLGEFGGKSLSTGAYAKQPANGDWTTYGAGLVSLAELAGVSDRTLREIVLGQRESVQYATADAICVALDTPIRSVYL